MNQPGRHDRLKIALVRKRYTSFGGAERIIDRTIEALRQYNAEITLISQSWQGEAPCNTHICNPFSLTRTGRDKRFARAACEHINSSDYDLVQSHERIACCDIFRAGDGLHHSWLEQRKRVLTPAQRFALEINPYHRYMLNAERELFHSPRLKAVICISQMVKQEVKEYFGLADEMLRVIYNGIDTDVFHPRLKEQHRSRIRAELGIAESAPVMLYVGSGFERKGVAALLQAMTELPNECQLIIVGKDKQAAKYQRKATELGVDKRVHFTGPQKDVKPYYGAADAFVLPTLYEPFGNVVLEAMASGLPVIASTKCGGSDIIEPGVNGFVCDALDIESLSSHMATLCDSALCQTMAEAARKTAEPMTLERMGQEMITLYQALLEQPGATQATS